MGFFKTVKTLCTRVSAFPELLQTPVWRAILHSVLLLLLCPLIAASVQTCRERKNCSETMQRLSQESGGIGFRGDTIALGNSQAEQHYAFELFNSYMRLDYVTEKEQLDRVDPAQWKEQTGVLLTHHKGIFWEKLPDGSFRFWDVPADVLKVYFMPETASESASTKLYQIAANSSTVLRTAEELRAAAAEKLSPAAKTETEKTDSKATPEFSPQDPARMVTLALSLFWTMAFSMIFLEGLLMFAFGSFCFAFMEFLYLRMMPNKLPYGKVYMLTLYAMFPAMIIASLSVLLGQTFLSFQTVFLIAFFIYQLFSFKHLGLHLNPPDKRKQDDFTDDDL